MYVAERTIEDGLYVAERTIEDGLVVSLTGRKRFLEYFPSEERTKSNFPPFC